MATKKTSVDTEQENLNELIKSAHEEGKQKGFEETIEKIENILRQRAVHLFLNNHDELAKEFRAVAINIKASLLDL